MWWEYWILGWMLLSAVVSIRQLMVALLVKCLNRWVSCMSTIMMNKRSRRHRPASIFIHIVIHQLIKYGSHHLIHIFFSATFVWYLWYGLLSRWERRVSILNRLIEWMIRVEMSVSVKWIRERLFRILCLLTHLVFLIRRLFML